MWETVQEKVGKLVNIIKKSDVNWNLFDEELRRIEDINIFNERYEETILTELIKERCFYKNGKLMTEAIKHFLLNGYDVKANDGLNGAFVLKDLVYSSHDKYILDSAKLLLDYGSPITHRSTLYEDKEFAGVIGRLEWCIPGAWGPDANYEMANILETYYEIVEAYQAGKKYSDIDSFHSCIGKTVTKVSFAGDASALKKRKETTEFDDKLVMWFGDCPLVINNYMDIIVNPLFVSENKERLTDVSSHFDKIIGSKIKEVKYIDGITFYFDFDNGFRLFFSNYENKDQRNGLFEIRKSDENNKQQIKILEILSPSGWKFAEKTTEYYEKKLVLAGKDKVICIFPENKTIGRIICSRELMADCTRKYPLSEIAEEKKWAYYDKTYALRFRCKEGYLHIKESGFGELEIVLCEEKFNLDNESYIPDNAGIHMHFWTTENGL